MGPDHVSQVTGEVRIFRRGEPISEDLAPAFIFDLRDIAPEKFWRHSSARHEVFNLAAGTIKNNSFTWIIPRLAANLGKKGGKTVVVIHCPPVKGMIVALSALHAHS